MVLVELSFLNILLLLAKMGGGLDILIVGIVGNDLYDTLSSVATKEFLQTSFSDHRSGRNLERRYGAKNPAIIFLSGECGFGAVTGTGLGYILFSGNNNAPPEKLDERIFARIPELIERFKEELDLHNLDYSKYEVGLHAINVYDT